MPLSGVDVKDLRDWLGLKSFKVVKGLENRSWLVISSNGIALHPIIRDVVRYELPLKPEEAETFLKAFNETIREEKSWHFSIAKKGYYADICSEIISIFKEINEHTLQLYINVELLFSFSIRPSRAVELGKRLYDYFVALRGADSYDAGYCAFQTGWTYLFNLHLPNALKDAEEWLELSYKVLSKLTFTTQNEFAVYGHCLTHLSRIYLIAYKESKDQTMLDKAIEFSQRALDNALEHFDSTSPFYSRRAVAYMQLADAYIACERYEEALKLVDDAYSIMYSLFGAEDPDALNVSSSKSTILYYLGRYEEALVIGEKNLETYTKFYGELNFLRFEQLMVTLKCHIKLDHKEKAAAIKADAIRIGNQLLSPESEQYKELQQL